MRAPGAGAIAHRRGYPVAGAVESEISLPWANPSPDNRSMPLPDRDRFRLLHGPYNAPKTRKGGMLTCLVRGKVRVDGISTARISWPMATPPKRGGRKSLVLCGDLARAVRMESAQAVVFWFGVFPSIVRLWRRALGVERNNDGSQKLRAKLWKDGGVGKAIHEGRDRLFTPEEDALLGAATDREIAERLGRSTNTVGVRRARLGIPSYRSVAGGAGRRRLEPA